MERKSFSIESLQYKSARPNTDRSTLQIFDKSTAFFGMAPVSSKMFYPVIRAGTVSTQGNCR
jgi:hypothetical protein